MARAGHQQGLHGFPKDQPVEMRVDEIDAWARTPVPEQLGLDMPGLQWRAKQHIILQVNLRCCEVIDGAKIPLQRWNWRLVDHK